MNADPSGGVHEPMPSASARRSVGELRFVVAGAYVADCFIDAERLPVWGEEYEARSIRTTPGGKALNQAVALARIGAHVTAVGVVGDDGLGRDIVGALARERVDVSWMESREDVATAICLCFVSDEGDSSIVWHIDDDVAVAPSTVRAATLAFERADAVLTTFEIPVPAIRETIETAHRYGARIFVQPAPVLADPAEAAVLPWDKVDVLVPNELEARALLSGTGVGEVPSDDLAAVLSAELGVHSVVVTFGAAGCVAHTGGMSHRYPAPETFVVDVTGASDAFTATFAAQLTAGASPAEAVAVGQTAAARAIQRAGGYESMPTPG